LSFLSFARICAWIGVPLPFGASRIHRVTLVPSWLGVPTTSALVWASSKSYREVVSTACKRSCTLISPPRAAAFPSTTAVITKGPWPVFTMFQAQSGRATTEDHAPHCVHRAGQCRRGAPAPGHPVSATQRTHPCQRTLFLQYEPTRKIRFRRRNPRIDRKARPGMLA
jgi:hypothetical protein